MSRPQVMKLALLGILCVAAVALVDFFSPYLEFAAVKEKQATLQGLVDTSPLAAAGGFFMIYIVFITLSVPGVIFLLLIAGAMFGFVMGTLLVSFANSIGATGAFLVARYVLRDPMRRYFSRRLHAFDAGVARDGIYYLVALRLLFLIPSSVVNLVMGVTKMPVRRFYLATQIGMLPGLMVYVNAGTQLAAVESPADVLTWRVVLSLTALGLLPLAWKWLLRTRHRPG